MCFSSRPPAPPYLRNSCCPAVLQRRPSHSCDTHTHTHTHTNRTVTSNGRTLHLQYMATQGTLHSYLFTRRKCKRMVNPRLMWMNGHVVSSNFQISIDSGETLVLGDPWVLGHKTGSIERTSLCGFNHWCSHAWLFVPAAPSCQPYSVACQNCISPL